MTLHVGFTGTRHGMTSSQIVRVSAFFAALPKPVAIHLGDCHGADTQAFGIAKVWGLTTIVHPPHSPRLRSFLLYDEERPARGYIQRDQDIVNESVRLFATPNTKEESRSGTWTTVRYARRQGRPVCIILPDGGVSFERWESVK